MAALAASSLCLAGCVGTTYPAPPAEGYATISSVVGPGSTFSNQKVERIVLVNGLRDLKRQNVGMSISADGTQMDLFLNDKTIQLTQDPSNPTLFYGPDTFVQLGGTSNPDVWMVFALRDTDPFSSATGYENLGSFVVGYQTDPRRIETMTGTASFSGGAWVDFYAGNSSEIGSGTATFTADFTKGAIFGDIFVTDDNPGTGPAMPDILFRLNPSKTQNIDFNSFIGPGTVSLGPAPGDTVTFTDAGLDGKFYGFNATSVGGTFWQTGTFNGLNMLVQGAFTAN